MSIEALRALVAGRLEAHRVAVVEGLKPWGKLTPESPTIMAIEVFVGDLTYSFPASIHFDDPVADLPLDPFTALPALITEEEEAGFTIWKPGPEGPQHALDQPVLDGAKVEGEVIIPWLIEVATAAGLDQASFGVEIGLHDHAEPHVLTEPPGGLTAYEAAVAEAQQNARQEALERARQAATARAAKKAEARAEPHTRRAFFSRLFDPLSGGRS